MSLRRLVFLVLALLAAACSSAIGDRTNPSAEGAQAAGADGDTVFGASDLAGFQQADGYAVSAVITAAGAATRGGFLVDLWADVGDAAIGAEVRGVRADGSTTAWVPATITWHETPHLVARADLGESVGATQFRIPIAQISMIQNVIYAGVTPDEHNADDRSAGSTSGVGSTSQPLVSELVGLVQPRSAWGARTPRCSSKDTNKYRMAIHHTFTPPSSSGGYESRIRSIQAFHMDTRGWCDIGYHFLVTEDGRVWEGRPVDTLGAHVSGNNTGNIGLSWVGCYDSKACSGISSSNVPTDAAIEAAGHVMKALADKYGISADTSTIKGHRDFSGASTECPGDQLHERIPDLIAMAAGQVSQPAPPAGGATGRAIGVVWDASKTASPSDSGNVRIAGATISVEGGPTTTARSGDALWIIDLPPGSYTITASAPGYQTATETLDVASGADAWGSIGLVPDNAAPGPTPDPAPAPDPTPASFSTPESAWTCGGTAGTHPSASGSYYVTSFGCWVDANGVAHGDAGDNCIPWCTTGAASQGRSAQWNALCGGKSGPDCERSVNWYTADADRFGCATRLRVTNPANGKSAVLAVIDRGPACWVEAKVSHWALDMSTPASNYLFGEVKAVTEKGDVHVEIVPDTTPLGPE